MPSGESIKAIVGFGFNYNGDDPQIEKLQYDSQIKGFWFTFTGVERNGEKKCTEILILEEIAGREAVLIRAAYQNRLLMEVYQKARKEAVYVPNPEIDCSGLFSQKSALQKAFLLPTGESLGEIIGIGLPASCSEQKLVRASYNPERKEFCLRFSAKSQNYQIISAEVLVLEGKQGKEAIFTGRSPFRIERAQQAQQLLQAYHFVKQNGLRQFDPALDCSRLIKSDGSIQACFPLPSGRRAGSQFSVSLFKQYESVEIQKLRYDGEVGGFWK